VETGPLNYFWFPLQLPFFLLGILSYRWTRVSGPFWKKTGLALAARVAVLGLLAGYGLMPDSCDQAISCGVLALLIPGLFEGEGRWQKRLGELSYPIYVVHILVKWVFLAAEGVERTGQAEVSGLWLLGGSVLVSVAIEKVVGAPLERWRQKRIRTEPGPARGLMA
jgi:peptidoglycan/LPS O-acetylase OafA/YrhL